MDTQAESKLLISNLRKINDPKVSRAFSSWLDTLISKADLTSTLQSIQSQSGKSKASGGNGNDKSKEIAAKLQALNSLNYLSKMDLIRQNPLSNSLVGSSSASSSGSSSSSSPSSPSSSPYSSWITQIFKQIIKNTSVRIKSN